MKIVRRKYWESQYKAYILCFSIFSLYNFHLLYKENIVPLGRIHCKPMMHSPWQFLVSWGHEIWTPSLWFQVLMLYKQQWTDKLPAMVPGRRLLHSSQRLPNNWVYHGLSCTYRRWLLGSFLLHEACVVHTTWLPAITIFPTEQECLSDLPKLHGVSAHHSTRYAHITFWQFPSDSTKGLHKLIRNLV